MNTLALNNLGINYMTQEARQLQEWFFNDEIDEETYELQHQFNLEEIQEKAPAIIEILINTENYIKNVKDRAKALNELGKWLEKKSEKFNEAITNCLVANNIPTGFTKGFFSENGILYLSKTSCEIKPDLEKLDTKYKKRKIELDLTAQEFMELENVLPKNLFEKIKIKEIKLDKEFYESENGKLERKSNYKVKVK